MGCRKLQYYFRDEANSDYHRGSAAHFEYSPFGKTTVASGSIPNRFVFRFSSEYHDSETNLVYYNYRYYSPELGRWLSRDPIGENGGWNLYGFVGNDGINGWDYLGGETIKWEDKEPQINWSDFEKGAINEHARIASGIKATAKPDCSLNKNESDCWECVCVSKNVKVYAFMHTKNSQKPKTPDDLKLFHEKGHFYINHRLALLIKPEIEAIKTSKAANDLTKAAAQIELCPLAKREWKDKLIALQHKKNAMKETTNNAYDEYVDHNNINEEKQKKYKEWLEKYLKDGLETDVKEYLEELKNKGH